LLEESFAAEVVELSEYALAKIERIGDYAVHGVIYTILEDLHHEACKRATTRTLWNGPRKERGSSPTEGHPDLRRFLADEYHDRGRHEEAMDLIWTGFAEELRLDGYEEPKAHADRAGT